MCVINKFFRRFEFIPSMKAPLTSSKINFTFLKSPCLQAAENSEYTEADNIPFEDVVESVEVSEPK